ncbi:MAG TPA: DUF177 domain-containing protein [Thermoanaerobaculia bacterium]|nr:DUF177 domain-containing protein [Thermoanaerobaculia bacterium]
MKQFIDFDTIDDQGPQTYHGSYDVNAADLDRDEVANVGNVSIKVKAEQGHLDGEYIADGTVTFTADMSCSRCADPYPFANTSTFHVRFRPRPEASRENEEVEITDEEELDVEFYSDRTIPLRDLALEQVQLSIPMKPLCDESCLGLCPTCGVNRSREDCSCGESIVDQRWGALKDIREELSKKKNV